MAELIFFEKPGCVGNARQKAVLRQQGFQLQVRDLLCERWSAERLRPFFADAPVRDWFNPTAPRIKNGELDIAALDETQALELMVAEPLLIRRPLMQYGALQQAGFVNGAVLQGLGVSLDTALDLQLCPMTSPCEPKP